VWCGCRRMPCTCGWTWWCCRLSPQPCCPGGPYGRSAGCSLLWWRCACRFHLRRGCQRCCCGATRYTYTS
jgi:hypothetical protein